MQGRKPKSANQHIAEGDPSKFGVHKLEERRDSEPQPTVGLPECPDRLQGLAREAWELWKEELEVMKVDRRCDAPMLEGACVWWARAVDADEMLSNSGQIVKIPIFDKEGNRIGDKIAKHPALEVSREAWGMVRSFCSEFGLSPSSRTRLAVERETTPEEDLQEILNRPLDRPLKDGLLQ